MQTNSRFAPGSRILVRDAEWIIKKVDLTSTGGQKLVVTGLSEIVKDREAVFLTEVGEKHPETIEILDPAETEIVCDRSAGYLHSRLYLQSIFMAAPITHHEVSLGREAAMDLLDFQLKPSRLALQKPRQRILIADAVGLGKTLEAGILMSELIARGRGRRILVLTVKSMMTQFQKELWNRFAIGLTRLDSTGLQRIRAKVPSNYNPFHYYDRTIISIDTLKNDSQYRTWLEQAYWDVIVIDEAHNVAVRGGGTSQRARLAKLLSHKSDHLIMLSATPHDGRPESFASLMKMLDPTAIADESNYSKEEIKGLYVRRFRSHVEDQLGAHYKQRKIETIEAKASQAEERAFDLLKALDFTKIDRRNTGNMLFKVLLEKSLFSSPAACIDTLNRRIKKLSNLVDDEYQSDIEQLKDLREAISNISLEEFSKFNQLIQFCKNDLSFTGRERDDRLVIFTERIETMNFLHEHLPAKLRLNSKKVAVLHGRMSDTEQQKMVEDFGREEADIRLLIASDVASEGINLHYFCNRLIHFDVPWSLMVFQQRNGRVDRYGQKRQPHISYFQTLSENNEVRGDARILQILIEKDEQAHKNIGDPSAFMGVYNVEQEEAIVAKAMQDQMKIAEFEKQLNVDSHWDPFADDEFEVDDSSTASSYQSTQGGAIQVAEAPQVFNDLFEYCCSSLQEIDRRQYLDLDIDRDNQSLLITLTDELKRRFRQLPSEIWRADKRLGLSPDKSFIIEEIEKSRQAKPNTKSKNKDEQFQASEKGAWPDYHYLWPLHPFVGWVHDKNLAYFGRQQAPFIECIALGSDEIIFLTNGVIPNRRGQSIVHEWPAVRFRGGQFDSIMSAGDLVELSGVNTTNLPNRQNNRISHKVFDLRKEAVQQASKYMSKKLQEYNDWMNPLQQTRLDELENLRSKHKETLDLKGKQRKIGEDRQAAQMREIDKVFDTFMDWIQDSATGEDRPFVQIVAVFGGVNHGA